MTEFWGSFFEGFTEGFGLLFRPFWRILRPHLTFRNIRHFAAWCLAIYLGQTVLLNAWRVDGHVTCDFAGQWVMGRMFAAGKADGLYIVPQHKPELAYGFVEAAGDDETLDAVRQRNLAALAEFRRRCRETPESVNDQLDLLFAADPGPAELNFTHYTALFCDILRKGMDPKPSHPEVEPHTLLPAAGPWGWSILLPPLELIQRTARNELVPCYNLVEGPLYPPTAGLLFWPLGWFTPKVSHMAVALFYALSVVGSGFFISSSTDYRLQWGEAALMVTCFPNFLQALLLGQNSLLTLLIASAGWWLFARKKRPFLAGVVWALLAYKPVFAVGLLLVPLALPSWRLLLGMVLGGAAFVFATLPFVGTQGLDRLVTQNEHARRLFGIQAPLEPITDQNWRQTNAWERWLLVGKHAAHMYNTDKNWVWMSRDLSCLPFRKVWTPADLEVQLHYWKKRYLEGVDQWNSDKEGYTTTGDYQFHTLQAVHLDDPLDPRLERISLGLIASVVGLTLLFGWLGRLVGWWLGFGADSIFETDRRAFLLTGGMLACFHFMHYDVLLFTLPAALCLSQLARYGWVGRTWIVVVVIGFVLCYWDLWYPAGVIRFPFETGFMLLLWLGCLARMAWLTFVPGPPRPAEVIVIS